MFAQNVKVKSPEHAAVVPASQRKYINIVHNLEVGEMGEGSSGSRSLQLTPTSHVAQHTGQVCGCGCAHAVSLLMILLQTGPRSTLLVVTSETTDVWRCVILECKRTVV